MKELPHTHYCFVCGESNALGLNLRFYTDGRIVQTRFTPKPEHIGFKSVVHGGILATVLDEIMVWACAAPTGKFAFCVELLTRFHKPARANEELLATAELVANRKNRVFEAKGELRNPAGEVICSATGKYFAIPDTDVKAMEGDLVGPRDWRPATSREDSAGTDTSTTDEHR